MNINSRLNKLESREPETKAPRWDGRTETAKEYVHAILKYYRSRADSGIPAPGVPDSGMTLQEAEQYVKDALAEHKARFSEFKENRAE